jgi:UDP-GlcNAc:undecaprenyl-phosphate GlcNAc-1-phosphate transferase
VLILWAWTAVLSGFILFPLYVSSVNAVIPFGVVALGVLLFATFHPGLRGRDAEADGPVGDEPADTGDVVGNAVDQGIDATHPLPPVDVEVTRH